MHSAPEICVCKRVPHNRNTRFVGPITDTVINMYVIRITDVSARSLPQMPCVVRTHPCQLRSVAAVSGLLQRAAFLRTHARDARLDGTHEQRPSSCVSWDVEILTDRPSAIVTSLPRPSKYQTSKRYMTGVSNYHTAFCFRWTDIPPRFRVTETSGRLTDSTARSSGWRRC